MKQTLLSKECSQHLKIGGIRLINFDKVYLYKDRLQSCVNFEYEP